MGQHGIGKAWTNHLAAAPAPIGHPQPATRGSSTKSGQRRHVLGVGHLWQHSGGVFKITGCREHLQYRQSLNLLALAVKEGGQIEVASAGHQQPQDERRRGRSADATSARSCLFARRPPTQPTAMMSLPHFELSRRWTMRIDLALVVVRQRTSGNEVGCDFWQAPKGVARLSNGLSTCFRESRPAETQGRRAKSVGSSELSRWSYRRTTGEVMTATPTAIEGP